MPMGVIGIRFQSTRREHLGGLELPGGATDLRRTASEDEVAVVEIGDVDTLEDEDVGTVLDDGVVVDLHDPEVGHAVHSREVARIDPVETVTVVRHHVAAAALLEDEGVVARTARELIVARAALQHVVAQPAGETIITGTTRQLVIAGAAVELIGAAAAVELVIAVTAFEP